MTQETAFYLLAIIAVLAAVTAVRLRNLIHGVFALVIFFAALAGLFLLLMAQFIAAVQVLVYIGAVGILLLFAIMLTERVTGDDGRRITSRGGFWGATAALGVAVFVLLPGIQQTDLNRLPLFAPEQPRLWVLPSFSLFLKLSYFSQALPLLSSWTLPLCPH